MNQDFEKNLGEGLEKLFSGKTPSEITGTNNARLFSALSLAQSLKTLPKKSVPQPLKQRKYILAEPTVSFFDKFKTAKFLVSGLGSFILLLLVAGTGVAAQQSLPGSPLFKVKKLAEHARLSLAISQQDKIYFQVSLAQKRLDDAKTILNNTASAPEQKAAALNELAEETKNTVTALKQSSDSVLGQKNHPLIASLNSLSDEQQNLTKNITTNKDDFQNKDLVSATLASSAQAEAIDQYVKTASKDQALADLNSNPAAVTAIGPIEQIGQGKISVNKQSFNVNEKTLVRDEKGAVISFSDLKKLQFVEVLGDKNDAGYFARQISVLTESAYKSKVKGDFTSNPSPTTTPTTEPKTATSSPSTQITLPENNPNTAIGTFILEDPAPQTHFEK